jgi:predicted ATPase
MATKGYAAPEVEHTYARARELCQLVGDTPQLGPTLWGLHRFYLIRGQYQTAHELGEQFLSLARNAPALLLAAYTALGSTCFLQGQLSVAHAHLGQELPRADAPQRRALALRYGVHPGVLWFGFTALDLWCLGDADAALQRVQAALALAQELDHPFSLTVALVMTAIVQQFRRDLQETHAQAETALTLATEQGFPFLIAADAILRGWALAAQGQVAEGIPQMHQGLAAYLATGAEMLRPYWLALLAEAYGKAGQAEEGLHALAQALVAVHNTGEHWCEAELYRLKGALLLWKAVPDAPQAEACFRQALVIARQQQAKSLELRAAMSLSRLRQQQGKRQEAHALLAEVYGWFTEGFDTADLQEAKALLEELAG